MGGGEVSATAVREEKKEAKEGVKGEEERGGASSPEGAARWRVLAEEEQGAKAHPGAPHGKYPKEDRLARLHHGSGAADHNHN